MHKGWFIVRMVASIIMLVVLVLGGIALFNAGWSQGYMVGSVAAAPSTVAPAVPYGFYHPMFFHGFMGFGLLIPALLFGLLLLTGLRFLFFRPMMMWHGWHGQQFGPRGPFGPMGPYGAMAGRCDPKEMEHWRQEWQKWHEQASGSAEKTESTAKPGE